MLAVVVSRPQAGPEIFRKVAKILGAEFDLDLKLLGDRSPVSLAVTGEDDTVDVLGNFEMSLDPLGVHQGRDRDREDGNLVFKRLARLELGKDASERRLGESSRDKQQSRRCSGVPRIRFQRTAPPLTRMIWPVTKAACGPTRNCATLAISSGKPQRWSGVSRRTRSCQLLDVVSPHDV